MNLTEKQFSELTLDLLNLGHTVSFPAAGSSMSPFIRNGDILTAICTPPDSLRTGDVILYTRSDGKPVAHRILDKSMIASDSAVLTRGDACWNAPERVPLSRIAGKVVNVQRAGRNISTGNIARTTAILWANLQPLPYLLLKLIRIPKAALWAAA